MIVDDRQNAIEINGDGLSLAHAFPPAKSSSSFNPSFDEVGEGGKVKVKALLVFEIYLYLMKVSRDSFSIHFNASPVMCLITSLGDLAVTSSG